MNDQERIAFAKRMMDFLRASKSAIDDVSARLMLVQAHVAMLQGTVDAIAKHLNVPGVPVPQDKLEEVLIEMLRALQKQKPSGQSEDTQ